jgi:hypothetical protein
MKGNLHTKKRGTTLIEFILYLAITTGLLIGVGMSVGSVLEEKTKTRAIADAIQDAGTLVRSMKNTCQRYEAIVPPPFGIASTTIAFSDSATGTPLLALSYSAGAISRTIASGSVEILSSPELYIGSATFTPYAAGSRPLGVLIAFSFETGKDAVASHRFADAIAFVCPLGTAKTNE